MSKLTYPRTPTETAAELAREILRGRFISDHKDYNRMLAAVRERGLPVEHAFCGESAALSISVVEAIAEENLRAAPQRALERKIKTLIRRVESSVSASLLRFDPNRLGGPGAAGRERDRARAAEGRCLTRMMINRLESEIARRESEALSFGTISVANDEAISGL
ncbi:TPA: hypothetical protein L4559_005192 [Pseudomonas aeruginosa]|nr:hypothetical protein [Pseudomonas aeruginosa]